MRTAAILLLGPLMLSRASSVSAYSLLDQHLYAQHMAPSAAVHEILTQATLFKLGQLKSDEDFTSSRAWETIRGSVWNDDPECRVFVNNLPLREGIQGASGSSLAYRGAAIVLSKKSQIAGNGFLHAMASPAEKREKTVSKMLLWAEFTGGVALGLIRGDQAIGSTAIGKAGILAGVLPSQTPQGLFSGSCTPMISEVQLKARALGSLLHMIQDSYAVEMHVVRASSPRLGIISFKQNQPNSGPCRTENNQKDYFFSRTRNSRFPSDVEAMFRSLPLGEQAVKQGTEAARRLLVAKSGARSRAELERQLGNMLAHLREKTFALEDINGQAATYVGAGKPSARAQTKKDPPADWAARQSLCAKQSASLEQQAAATEKLRSQIAGLAGKTANLFTLLRGSLDKTKCPDCLLLDSNGIPVLQLPSTVQFPSGKAALNSVQLNVDEIKQIANVLRRLVEDPASKPMFVVYGHTDASPIYQAVSEDIVVDGKPRKHFYYNNRELGAQRATEVIRYLTRVTGIEEQYFVAASYGEHRPAGASHAANRRVTIEIHTDFSPLFRALHEFESGVGHP